MAAGGDGGHCHLLPPGCVHFAEGSSQRDAGLPLGGRQPPGTVWGAERQGDGGLISKIRDFLFLDHSQGRGFLLAPRPVVASRS